MNKNMITAAVDNAVQKQEIENGEGVSLTEEQKQKIKSDIESKAILYTPSGDGELSAVLTDKMITDAEKVAGDYFEGQVDSKVSVEAAKAYRGDSYREQKDRGRAQDELNEFQRGYVASLNAFAADDKGNIIKGKTPDFSGLDDSYQYRNYNGKVYVYKMGSFDASGGKTENAVLIRTVSEPKGLAQYTVYGKSPAESATNYERGRTQYRTSKGLSGNTSGNKPAAKPKSGVNWGTDED